MKNLTLSIALSLITVLAYGQGHIPGAIHSDLFSYAGASNKVVLIAPNEIVSISNYNDEDFVLSDPVTGNEVASFSVSVNNSVYLISRYLFDADDGIEYMIYGGDYWEWMNAEDRSTVGFIGGNGTPTIVQGLNSVFFTMIKARSLRCLATYRSIISCCLPLETVYHHLG